MANSFQVQEQLRLTKNEHAAVTEEIKTLRSRQRTLASKITALQSSLDLLNGSTDAKTQFDRDDFPWSAELQLKMKSVFHIENFRSHQKPAINATMSKQDCILIMPTGGGKSLCFQLPAILSASVGVTLVVSPLISLMEDQLQALEQLQIPSAIFNAQTKRAEWKDIFKRMTDKDSDLKMLYVTPEKLAKSKTLMSNLEKMYRAGRFARLVIDEVHCCSSWGHDFRPDYKFLGIMKTQYPNTPIIGLTATATTPVIVDVQKILNIEGSLLFKDSFFRSNLKYEVEESSTKDKADDIADMIKARFSGQSGIIYCLTIKDTEDVAQRLKELGISAGCYHAQMEPEDRTRVQKRWYSGGIHVIVATVAFGMGINKLDVRYVIHHSMSKSVENYYQETGRAGRDGETAWCILFYRFLDTFRISSLMFTEKNGQKNVHKMLLFSINRQTCRKALLAQHFGDEWELEGCGEMCDNCEIKASADSAFETIDAVPLLKDLLKLLEQADSAQERMTGLKLMDAWFGKGNKKNRHDEVPVPKQSRTFCETVLALLMTDGYLTEEFHFTPYSTISYIIAGKRAQPLQESNIIYKILTRKESGGNLGKTKTSTKSSEVKSKPSTKSKSSSSSSSSGTTKLPAPLKVKSKPSTKSKSSSSSSSSSTTTTITKLSPLKMKSETLTNFKSSPSSSSTTTTKLPPHIPNGNSSASESNNNLPSSSRGIFGLSRGTKRTVDGKSVDEKEKPKFTFKPISSSKIKESKDFELIDLD